MYDGNQEYEITIRDFCYDPVITWGPQDLATVNSQIEGVLSAPVADSTPLYDARAVFDSRPVLAYDFNFSGSTGASPSAAWTIQFPVPNGYRAVPREWDVIYDNPGSGSAADSYVTFIVNGSAVPNNSGIIIGAGTNEPIKSFFLVEEGNSFGMTGVSSNLTGDTTVSVNVYGNLIPVTLDQLPFSVVNPKAN